MANVYIENGAIVLIDNDGVAYEKELKQRATEIFFTKIKANLFLVVSIICLFMDVSQIFLSFLSFGQIFIFLAGAVIAGVISENYFSDVETFTNNLKSYEGEFNQCKCRFQNRILELEKELVRHEKEIEEIRCSQELDFAKNFKKQESKIPKSMLANS